MGKKKSKSKSTPTVADLRPRKEGPRGGRGGIYVAVGDVNGDQVQGNYIGTDGSGLKKGST